eukprot:751954-Hanusia_phi.AAC.2
MVNNARQKQAASRMMIAAAATHEYSYEDGDEDVDGDVDVDGDEDVDGDVDLIRRMSKDVQI